jgi:hypothetical protein
MTGLVVASGRTISFARLISPCPISSIHLTCSVAMSEDAASHVGDGIVDWLRREVEVRGRVGTMTVVVSDARPA